MTRGVLDEGLEGQGLITVENGRGRGWTEGTLCSAAVTVGNGAGQAGSGSGQQRGIEGGGTLYSTHATWGGLGVRSAGSGIGQRWEERARKVHPQPTT